MLSRTIFLALILFTAINLSAQTEDKSYKDEFRTNILFGLNQPLLGGFNSEINFFYKGFVFDYSHGVSLNFDNEFLDDENKNLGIDVHVPWTTGFGIGYQLNSWLNLRAEPKWHKFELYSMGLEQTQANLITSYTTFSMGIGAYANFRPFKNQDNFLKGFMLAPSIRWWPRVSSSLDNDEITYFDESIGENRTHNAMEVGVANTPLIINLSIGYSFGWQ